MHTGGSKSFVKHAIEIEKDPNRDAPPGTPATRVELYKKVHTRKNKAPISDLAKMKMDEMKEKTDKAIEEGLDIYESEPNDIFSLVIGADSRSRRRCFVRATFPGESSNSKKDSVEVMTLKRKVVEVEEELQSTKQQYTDLKNTTNQMQDSLSTTNAELNKMKGLLQLFLATGNPLLQTQVQGDSTDSTPTPSSAAHPNNQ